MLDIEVVNVLSGMLEMLNGLFESGKKLVDELFVLSLLVDEFNNI